jgi:hypothetical protein
MMAITRALYFLADPWAKRTLLRQEMIMMIRINSL